MRKFDWYGDFGINVFDSDGAYEDLPTTTDKFNNSEHGYFKNHTPGIKRFEHKEYAFKFSSHELNRIDLKAVLTLIEKVIVLEEWGYIPLCETLDPIRFSGKLKTFNIANIVINAILPIDSDGSKGYLNGAITKAIRIAKKKAERPVFFRRIPWELNNRFCGNTPISTPIWYPGTGYREVLDRETLRMRKPTMDEIVNNVSIYTRFSTGFV